MKYYQLFENTDFDDDHDTHSTSWMLHAASTINAMVSRLVRAGKLSLNQPPPPPYKKFKILGSWYYVDAKDTVAVKKAASIAKHAQLVFGDMSLDPWQLSQASKASEERSPHEIFIAQSPIEAAEYAATVIKGRWPEAEPKIMSVAYAAYIYASKVLHHRWPEAEPIIAASLIPAIWYARDVVNGRWSGVENLILENLKNQKSKTEATFYARDVIKGRWPEAEQYLVTNAGAAYVYARDVIKGRWPEAEPTIIRDIDFAMEYAKNASKRRWPELEKILLNKVPDAGSVPTLDQLARLYMVAVIKGPWPELAAKLDGTKACKTRYATALAKATKQA